VGLGSIEKMAVDQVCDCGNETSGSIKFGEMLEGLSNC